MFAQQEDYYAHLSAMFEWMLSINLELFELSYLVEFYYFSSFMLSNLLSTREEVKPLMLTMSWWRIWDPAGGQRDRQCKETVALDHGRRVSVFHHSPLVSTNMTGKCVKFLHCGRHYHYYYYSLSLLGFFFSFSCSFLLSFFCLFIAVRSLSKLCSIINLKGKPTLHTIQCLTMIFQCKRIKEGKKYLYYLWLRHGRVRSQQSSDQFGVTPWKVLQSVQPFTFRFIVNLEWTVKTFLLFLDCGRKPEKPVMCLQP